MPGAVGERVIRFGADFSSFNKAALSAFDKVEAAGKSAFKKAFTLPSSGLGGFVKGVAQSALGATSLLKGLPILTAGGVKSFLGFTLVISGFVAVLKGLPNIIHGVVKSILGLAVVAGVVALLSNFSVVVAALKSQFLSLVATSPALRSFLLAIVGGFNSFISILPKVIHLIHQYELGLLTLAGPLGKWVVLLAEVASGLGLAGSAANALTGTATVTGTALLGLSAALFTVIGAAAALVFGLSSLSSAIGSKLLKVTDSWFRASADLQKSQFSLNIALRAFGQTSAGTALDVQKLASEISNLSAVTGISRAEIQQGLAIMLESKRVTGLSTEQIIELTKASADFAAVAGQDFLNVVLALDNAFIGNSQRAAFMGLALDETSVKTKALEKGLIKTGQAISESEMATIRQKVALEQMSFATGQAAVASNTLVDNALRRLNSELQRIKEALGSTSVVIWTKFYKALGDIAAFVREGVSPQVWSFIGGLAVLAGGILKVGGFLLKWGVILASTIAALKLAKLALLAFTAGGQGVAFLTAALERFAVVNTLLAAFGTTAGALSLRISSLVVQLSTWKGVTSLLSGTILPFFGKSILALFAPLASLGKFITLPNLALAALIAVLVKFEQETGFFVGVLKLAGIQLKALFGGIVELGPVFKIASTAFGAFVNVMVSGVSAAALAWVGLVAVVAKFQTSLAQLLHNKPMEEAGKQMSAWADEMSGKLQTSILNSSRSIGIYGGLIEDVSRKTEQAAKAQEKASSKFVSLSQEVIDKKKEEIKKAELLGDFAKKQALELEIFESEIANAFDNDVDRAKAREVFLKARSSGERQLEAQLLEAEGRYKEARDLGFEEEKSKLKSLGLEKAEYNELLRRLEEQKVVDEKRASDAIEAQVLESEGRISEAQDLRFEEEKRRIQKEVLDFSKAAELISRLEVQKNEERKRSSDSIEAQILQSEGKIAEARALQLKEEMRRLKEAGAAKEQLVRAEVQFEKETLEQVRQVRQERIRLIEETDARVRRSAAELAQVQAVTSGDELEGLRLAHKQRLQDIDSELKERVRSLQSSKDEELDIRSLVEKENIAAVNRRAASELELRHQEEALERKRLDEISQADEEARRSQSSLYEERLRVLGLEVGAEVEAVRSRKLALESEVSSRLRSLEGLQKGSAESEAKITAVHKKASAERSRIALDELKLWQSAIEKGAAALERLGVSEEANILKGLAEAESLRREYLTAVEGLRAAQAKGLDVGNALTEAQVKYNEAIEGLLSKYPTVASEIRAGLAVVGSSITNALKEFSSTIKDVFGKEIRPAIEGARQPEISVGAVDPTPFSVTAGIAEARVKKSSGFAEVQKRIEQAQADLDYYTEQVGLEEEYLASALAQGPDVAHVRRMSEENLEDFRSKRDKARTELFKAEIKKSSIEDLARRRAEAIQGNPAEAEAFRSTVDKEIEDMRRRIETPLAQPPLPVAPGLEAPSSELPGLGPESSLTEGLPKLSALEDSFSGVKKAGVEAFEAIQAKAQDVFTSIKKDFSADVGAGLADAVFAGVYPRLVRQLSEELSRG